MRSTSWVLSAGILLASSYAGAQTVNDPLLHVETVVTGLDLPSTMAFIGNNDFLVLQKNDGRVRRVTGGVLQVADVLDVPVDSAFDKGLLGIALAPDFVNDKHVFLYYSEATVDGIVAFGHDDQLYTVMGDLQRTGKLQNNATRADPDDTGIILRTNQDGSA